MIYTGLSSLFGIIVIFPFIISICIVLFYSHSGRKLTMKKIADYTTPFLFLSVYLIAHTIFLGGVGYVIAIIAIVIVLMIAVLERRRQKDFRIKCILRKAWRLFFILLFVVYLLLMMIGLVLTIIDQVT